MTTSEFQVSIFSGVREGNSIDCPMTPKKEYTTTDTHVPGHVDTSPKGQKHCWRLTVLVCQCFFSFFRFRTFFKVSRLKLRREERGNSQKCSDCHLLKIISSFKFQVSS